MGWFEKAFGTEPEQRGPAYDVLTINPNETVEVEFLEDHPRIVQTSVGERPVINVMYNNEPKSLWLSRVGLAREIALLEKQVSSLKGKKARITCTGKGKRAYTYIAEWVSKAPAAEELREKAASKKE